MFDFRLQVFKSVAQNLSFTKASAEMFITQPAVTKHIHELENELGVKLFNRTGNKITLTHAGSLLLSHAEHIQNLHNEIIFKISQLKGAPGGGLKIGASTTISQYVIPGALGKFHERYPDVKINLINGNTEFIEKRLLKNEIEIGIVEGKPSNSDIRYTPFLNDELLVFTSFHNKRQLLTVAPEKINTLPLVLRERGSGTLEVIEKYLQQLQISPTNLNVLMYLGSTEAIKTYIKTGNGVGIVSKYAIEEDLANNIFKTIEIAGLKFYRQFYFISPKGPEPQGLANLFLNFLTHHYNQKL
jgi:LysR family transcriptional regulator, transcriptional activator of the cysJI operon